MSFEQEEKRKIDLQILATTFAEDEGCDHDDFVVNIVKLQKDNKNMDRTTTIVFVIMRDIRLKIYDLESDVFKEVNEMAAAVVASDRAACDCCDEYDDDDDDEGGDF